MSTGTRPTRRRNQLHEAPRRVFTVYTWMLILAFLFITIGCVLLVMELMKYGLTLQGNPPWRTPETEISQVAPEQTVVAPDWLTA